MTHGDAHCCAGLTVCKFNHAAKLQCFQLQCEKLAAAQMDFGYLSAATALAASPSRVPVASSRLRQSM